MCGAASTARRAAPRRSHSSRSRCTIGPLPRCRVADRRTELVDQIANRPLRLGIARFAATCGGHATGQLQQQQLVGTRIAPIWARRSRPNRLLRPYPCFLRSCRHSDPSYRPDQYEAGPLLPVGTPLRGRLSWSSRRSFSWAAVRGSPLHRVFVPAGYMTDWAGMPPVTGLIRDDVSMGDSRSRRRAGVAPSRISRYRRSASGRSRCPRRSVPRPCRCRARSTR